MRRFEGKNVRAQKGEESHFVGDVQPTSDHFYKDGKQREAVGIYKRVARPDGVTVSELVEVVFADDKKSAEEIANEKVGDFSKARKSKQVDDN